MNGKPIAIAASESGFVIYHLDNSDKHKSMLALFSANGGLLWKRVIMNNGDKPAKAKEQITFHDQKGKLAFGMEAMYRPDSGKLVIGRNRIALIFSHYNNFKAEMGGFQAHTGDSTVSFDMNGNNVLLGSGWGTSHSLDQKIIYDGLQFLTSALGDAYPQQIKFTVNDGIHPSTFIDGKTGQNNRYDINIKTHVIPGTIPGNGKGKSCGRLGGLHVIRDINFQKYAQVYSRHACSSGLNKHTITNDKDEIGIVFFDRNLNFIEQHKIGDGWNVNSIKSAIYGRNIFVVYSKTNRKDSESSEFLPNTYNVDDTCYMMLIDSTGMKRSQEIKLEKCTLGNDDLVTLKNGNVAWTFVDINGKLTSYSLKTPAFELPETTSLFNDGDDGSDDQSPNGNNDSNQHTRSGIDIFIQSIWIWIFLFYVK
jgi:hypothetical protein